jgi:DNA-binding transcriptional MerR regulator/methylmalonyl-CoA mutase cobalamin-binding subunit
MASTSPSSTILSISAVERETGLTKDTLRVWERRYRFPEPGRDANGERVYSHEQVGKLRVLKRLIDSGHRPSKIVGRTLDDLIALAARAEKAPPATPAEHAHVLELLRTHRVADLRQALGAALLRQGLAAFVVETVGPLNRQVGDAWMRGQLEVFEEHLYTETLQRLLRSALAALPQRAQSPHVLLTTFPGELHGLGLLVAECMFALEGATCTPLGTQTPIRDIATAASSHGANVVALSFSMAYPVTQAVEGLAELRAALPPGIEVWAGGTNPGLARRAVAGVRVIPELAELPLAVAHWRGAAAGQT